MRSIPLVMLIAGLAGSSALAADKINFSRDVLPILSDNCFQCHGPDAKTRKADLRLDTREGSLRKDNPIIVPGKHAESQLIQRIRTSNPRELMPPAKSNKKLTPAQIAILERWIDEGAPWGMHWAYEPPQRPAMPTVKNPSWVRNGIDAFILARLEKEGLQPSPEAPREALIRRVTLDLTGLPPTPAEVDAFLADPSPNAYEKVVDRLLKSPHYGERLAWDWLDAARYADSNGYQGDPERTMWPWRDWVVNAFNTNQPYNQFTVEQLAGDLLPNATLSQKIATGFNRNHMHNGEGGRIAEETRIENVMDRVETTATVWLGLTMGCARCHDHKFDPLTMRDYYQMFAYFNNTSEEGNGRSGQNKPTVDVINPEDQAAQVAAAARVKPAAAAVSEIEKKLFPKSDKPAAGEPKLPEKVAAELKKVPDQRASAGLTEMINHFKAKETDYAKALTQLKKAIDERDAANRRIVRVMVMDELPKPRDTFMLVRGAYNKPGDKVTVGTPASLPALPANAPKNRLALAQWLVEPNHPLTARVTVNRYWQAIFGTGLVKTVEDFGVQGEKPSHPELLDWLATEFIASGWDLKALHRLIVTSATYRQSSKVTPLLHERDPENRLLARGSRYRLPSWMIRDQALAASGLLVSRLGGPSVKPYQPDGIWEEATFGQKTYKRDTGEALYRRSLYIFWRRIVGPTMFFDNSARQTCYIKTVRTNTPLHALLTLNDVTFVEAARVLAQRVLESAATPDERLTLAFRLLTARKPSTSELAVLRGSLDRLQGLYAADRKGAEQLLQVGEAKRNPKLDVVEHAAYTAVCSLILNLDETLNRQ